jgi:hypothetical protein
VENFEIGIERTPNLIPPNLHTKPKDLPWTNPKPRKTLNEDDIEWIEEQDSISGIPKMF